MDRKRTTPLALAAAMFVAAGALLLQVSSIAAAIVSREDSLFGWMEPTSDRAVEQALAVEAGAVLCLVALLALDAVLRRSDGTDAVTA